MPESKVRKHTAAKKKAEHKQELAAQRRQKDRLQGTSGAWVPWAFCIVGLLGVAWLVTFYIAGNLIPGMSELGNWNILIGMGLMAAAFGIATMWK
ncbi:cell division protein CrgA [Luteococcus sp. Sow4_B9]|uniref:cell division protein CrgA n=1 Tax=Luteococcus sp. Sow4_B9 TaxID=3438792 RepID=UPI003F9901D7